MNGNGEEVIEKEESLGHEKHTKQRKVKAKGPSVKSLLESRITDVGNLSRLSISAAGSMIFNCTDKQWYIWDGARFRLDNLNHVYQIVRTVFQKIYDEAKKAKTAAEKEILIDWARKSEMYGKIRDCIKLAETDTDFTILGSELDANPWLLGADNGTINLQTGELMQSKRSNKMTLSVGFSYDENAKCPVWKNFLETALEGNSQKIEYLQRAAGYSLTGNTTEDCFFLLLGIGKNGKSKFIDGLSFALGEYAETTPSQTFLTKTMGQQIPNDLAALFKSRMVFTSEPNKGSVFDETVIKQISGQDRIKARFLHKEWFSYTPKFKIWISANNTPQIRDLTQSIWERVKVIEFNRYFRPEERDKALRRKLEEERCGILRWAIDGCIKWQMYGLDEPEDIQTAVRNYQYAENSIARFIGECCEEGDAVKIMVQDFYRFYSDWCKRSNEKPERKTDVTSYLKGRGFRQDRIENKPFYIGIHVKLSFTESDRYITNW